MARKISNMKGLPTSQCFPERFKVTPPDGEAIAGRTFQAEDTNTHEAVRLIADTQTSALKHAAWLNDANSSHVVRLVAFGELAKTPEEKSLNFYLAVENRDENLLAFVRRRAEPTHRLPLSSDEFANWLLQTCDGLCHIHSKGLTHGNINLNTMLIKGPQLLFSEPAHAPSGGQEDDVRDLA